MIYLLTNSGEKNIALRFSEYEGLDTILNMKSKVKWVWVDCFTRLSITKKDYNILKQNGFNLCLVSPELQNQEHKLLEYKKYLIKEQIVFDAICTKIHNIMKWTN